MAKKSISAPAASFLRLLYELGYYEAPNRVQFYEGMMQRIDVLVVEIMNAGKAHTDATGIHFHSPRNIKPRYSEDFESFWRFYPRKISKQVAWKRWCGLLAAGTLPNDLLRATRNYVAAMQAEGREEKFIWHPTTFLNESRWQDYLFVEGQGKFAHLEGEQK